MAALNYPAAINAKGWGRPGEEIATCTQFNSTNETQNFPEDAKAGEVRTELLERTFSEGNAFIFAAQKEGSRVLPCQERRACCHQAFLRMLPLKMTQNNDEQVSIADGSLLHNSVLMTREILNMTGLFSAARDLY